MRDTKKLWCQNLVRDSETVFENIDVKDIKSSDQSYTGQLRNIKDHPSEKRQHY